MAVSVLEGMSEGNTVAVFLNGDSDCAFGPTMSDAGEAEAFLEWLPLPAEDYSDEALCERLTEFRQGQLATETEEETPGPKKCICGEVMELNKAPEDTLAGSFWTCPTCGVIVESPDLSDAS